MNARPVVAVLDRFSYIGPSRSGLLDGIADEGYDVICINFFGSSDPEQHRSQLHKLISSYPGLAGILSINSWGLSEPLLETIKVMGIPTSTWFVDSTRSRPFPNSINRTEVFLASRDFFHPRLNNPKFLPFGGYPPVATRRAPTKGLGFLGNIHHVRMALFRSAAGIVDPGTGRTLLGVDLYDAVRRPEFFDVEWQYPTGEAVNNLELYNYLSSLKRVQHLSQFAGLDLEICGPDNWLVELWTTAPNMLAYFRPAFVEGKAQMERFLTQYAVGLNIFHIQNETGGPNFRSLECASLRVPMLSDYNEGAAEIFPDGVAALYYRNIDDARYHAKTLLQSPAMQDELSSAAAEIVLQGHTHRHRARAILASFNGNVGMPRERGVICIGEFTAEGVMLKPMAIADDPGARKSQGLVDTQFYTDMLFWSEKLSVRDRRKAEVEKPQSPIWRGLQRLGIRRRSPRQTPHFRR